MAAEDERERPFSPAELDAFRGFVRTHAVIVNQLASHMEQTSELTLSEYEALLKLAISESGWLPMARLGAKTYLTLSASGLSRLVDRLVRRGLVVREPVVDGDRRGAVVRITDRGMELWRATAGPHQRRVREVFLDHLSLTDLTRLGGVWARLLEDEEPLDDE